MLRSKGLGDTIEKITTTTGVKSLVDFIFKKNTTNNEEDCGCEERKEKLNKLFPYGRQGKKNN